jgi:hypothetical protein
MGGILAQTRSSFIALTLDEALIVGKTIATQQ